MADALPPCCHDQSTGGQHLDHGQPHRRVLQHRAQVQRLVAHQINRLGATHDGSCAVIERIVPIQDHQRLDLDVQPFAPRQCGGNQALGVFEGIGRWEHDDLAGAGLGHQSPIEIVVGLERAAALERNGAGHAADCTRPAHRASTCPVRRVRQTCHRETCRARQGLRRDEELSASVSMASVLTPMNRT